MAQKKDYISHKGFFIIILVVVGLIVGTYFFTKYMLTGSSAGFLRGCLQNCIINTCKKENDYGCIEKCSLKCRPVGQQPPSSGGNNTGQGNK